MISCGAFVTATVQSKCIEKREAVSNVMLRYNNDADGTAANNLQETLSFKECKAYAGGIAHVREGEPDMSVTQEECGRYARLHKYDFKVGNYTEMPVETYEEVSHKDCFSTKLIDQVKAQARKYLGNNFNMVQWIILMVCIWKWPAGVDITWILMLQITIG